MKAMKGFFLIILLYLTLVSVAQPLARYNLYPFNPSFANPAATGLISCLQLNCTDMHQWVGIDDAPNIQSFSIQNGNQFSKSKKHGLGANLIRDMNGPSKSLVSEFLYSFHVLIGRNKETWLGFGLSGNIEHRRLDESGFSPIYDPLVTGEAVEEIAYNASGGFYLYNNSYFAGFAMYNLLPVNTTLGLGYGGDRYYISFQGGYLFNIRQNSLEIRSSVQGSIGKDIYQFDLNNKFIFESNLWTGLILRKYAGKFESSGQNAIVFVGYDWKRWSFSYNYNFDINRTQFHHYGTHQISLGYQICRDKYNCPAYK
jgi:type IX secretion system PorP/SprF family membrane protein